MGTPRRAMARPPRPTCQRRRGPGRPPRAPARSRCVQAPEPVVEHPNPYTLRSLFAQSLGKAIPNLVRSKDVVLEMNPALGARDPRDPIVEGVGSVLEQRNPVALAQRCIADPRQGTILTFTTSRRSLRRGGKGRVFVACFAHKEPPPVSIGASLSGLMD